MPRLGRRRRWTRSLIDVFGIRQVNFDGREARSRTKQRGSLVACLVLTDVKVESQVESAGCDLSTFC